jgi:hypothetical protein
MASGSFYDEPREEVTEHVAGLHLMALEPENPAHEPLMPAQSRRPVRCNPEYCLKRAMLHPSLGDPPLRP